MRKITQNAVIAFLALETFKLSNTEVEIQEDDMVLVLHGNEIAMWDTDQLRICDGNFPSKTTVERLDGLLQEYTKQNFLAVARASLVDGEVVISRPAVGGGRNLMFIGDEWEDVTHFLSATNFNTEEAARLLSENRSLKARKHIFYNCSEKAKEMLLPLVKSLHPRVKWENV